jgi:hypothetical protein
MPVVLTLETQDEVDAIYAVMNMGVVSDVVQEFSNGYDAAQGLRNALGPYVSARMNDLFTKISDAI